jgi:transposase-like protein
MKRTKKITRTFSTAFKKEKVALIESGKMTVRQLSKIYEVTPTAIYKWLRKYSQIEPGERVVVEKLSEEQKNIELMERIRELEQALGKKQLKVDYYESVIEELNELQGEDVTKKYRPRP